MKEKKYLSSSSITLTKGICVLFAVALVLVDIFAWWIIEFLNTKVFRGESAFESVIVLLVCLYICSIPAYVLLHALYRLLQNIEKDQVFVKENVSYLRKVSWCCMIASLVCALGSMIWVSLVVIWIAAGFVGLIVRVVKNIFEKAIALKEELDYVV